MEPLGDVQRNYLELLMQNYPEYKAGLFESTPPDPTFEDVFAAPTGPLYNVQPTKKQFESGTSYYDEGDVDVSTYAPAGPLYDIDPDWSEKIYDSLPTEKEKMDFVSSFTTHDDGSLSQNLYDPGVAPSYAEWQQKDFELPEKKFAGNVNIQDMEAWGSTPSNLRRIDQDPFEPSRISLQENLMNLVGTQPTSPRNEEKIYVGDTFSGFDMAYPKDINKFAAGVLGHEYRHNLLKQPGFEKTYEEAMDINPNKLFAHPKSVEYLPSVYAAGAYNDADDHLKEELFNEAADMYNNYLVTGKMSGILANQNLRWMNQNLSPFFRPKQDFKYGSGAMDYYNKMLPTIKKYFTEVDRQGRMGPVNKAKLKVGMPENLSFNTGASNVPKPYISPARPHSADPPSDRGRSRSRGETGRIAGGHHFSRGGLMDIPLSGRSRDI